MIKARPGNWRLAQQSLTSRFRRAALAGAAVASGVTAE
jgi:hypothetical protein